MSAPTPDLAALFAQAEGKVSDASITQVLCDRLDLSAPYTWASASMLVATNPCWDTSQLDADVAEAQQQESVRGIAETEHADHAERLRELPRQLPVRLRCRCRTARRGALWLCAL